MTACPHCRSDNFWILLEGGVECEDCGYDGTRHVSVLVIIACLGVVIGLGSIWWNLVNR